VITMSDDKPGKPGRPLAPLDPALFEPPEMLAALAAQDIGTAYRKLTEGGISQHQIARRTGQSQSEVCEILQGRTVGMYAVLVRICEGLGLPRELMGLSYGERGTYAGGVTDTESSREGVSAKMRRRALIAAGSVAAFGQAVLGRLLQLPGPSPVALPHRVDWLHVRKVRDLTLRLRDAGCAHGSDPEMCSAAAARATELLHVPGPEPVKRALMTAVAELHIEAGSAGLDAGLYDRAMHHLTRALDVATEVGDPCCQALALNYAGLATVEHGHPNDALKMLQLGQVKAWDIAPSNERTVAVGVGTRAALEACARADSATAHSALGQPAAAETELAKARELWHAARTDANGDLDRPAACFELDRGRLDVAEQLATASVRRWDGVSERARIRSGIVLATIHVRAGEPRGLQLAHDAITGAAQLGSVRARTRLEPLADALAARPGADPHELAVMARKVAATRV